MTIATMEKTEREFSQTSTTLRVVRSEDWASCTTTVAKFMCTAPSSILSSTTKRSSYCSS
jgi:hypothetical protein